MFGDADYFDDLVASVNDMTRGNDWFLLANGGREGQGGGGALGLLAAWCAVGARPHTALLRLPASRV